MTVDSLMAAAREQRLVSSGVDGVKTWLEAHQTVHGAVERVARPFAEPLKSLVGVADKAIGLSVHAVEDNVYRPVVEKNGDFTLSGAIEIANHNVTDLAKTTCSSVQKKMTCALNYVVPEDPAPGNPSQQKGPVDRIRSRAAHLVDHARDFSQKRLPIDVVGLADGAVNKSKSLASLTCQNARSALSVTSQTAQAALQHVSKCGIFALPKEVSIVGLQTIGLQSRGSEYDTVRNTIEGLLVAYKRLVLFQEPEKQQQQEKKQEKHSE